MNTRNWVSRTLNEGDTWSWILAKLIKGWVEATLSLVCAVVIGEFVLRFTPISELQALLGIATRPGIVLMIFLGVFSQVFNCTYEKPMES